MQSLTGEQAAASKEELAGKAALVASVGGQRGYADWTNPDHRLRRLLSEFIGMAGLTFVLSGGAAILARYGGHALQPWQTVLVLSIVSALWLVVAVYFLGDISAHFNPATTRGPPMNADDSARLRDLLANNRTLLAYIRTAVAFAGLGFAVAKFGLNPKMMHLSDTSGPSWSSPGCWSPSRPPSAASWLARCWRYISRPTLPE